MGEQSLVATDLLTALPERFAGRGRRLLNPWFCLSLPFASCHIPIPLTRMGLSAFPKFPVFGHVPSVTCLSQWRREIVFSMTHFPQVHPSRSPRIQLGGSIPALVMLEDGQRAKAKLQTVSVTGGLLRLAVSEPGRLCRGRFSDPVARYVAWPEMLIPVRATGEGSLQPFRFVALGDDDHRTLRMAVDSTTDRSFQGLRPASGPRLSRSKQLRELQV